MMPSEIIALMGALEKQARYRIAAHQQNVQSLGRLEGAAPLMPFFTNQGAAPVAPALPGGGSIQDAAAAELARRRGGR
jgi:hypothetical protein